MCSKVSHIICVLALVMAASSCSIFTPRRAPYYRAGEPEDPAYRPQGIVEQKEYPGSISSPESRRMIVYLPKDYYKDQSRYPVMYLFHGARGYETSWIKKGDFFHITDSLFNAGLARECIIVLPNMNQYNSNADYDGSRLKNALESILEIDGTVEQAFAHDVVAFVDSVYRTVPDKKHRAMAGLSVGALQTIYISANNPDMFGYLGMFSPYTKTIRKPGPYNDFYKNLHDKQQLQFVDPPKLYFISIGTADFFYPHVQNYRRYLGRNGYGYEYMEGRCGHDWPIWKDSYIHFLQNVFKDDVAD